MEYILQTTALGVWAASVVEGEAADEVATQDPRASAQSETLFARIASRVAEMVWTTTTRLRTYWSPAGFAFGVVVAIAAFAVLQLSQRYAGNGAAVVMNQGAGNQGGKTASEVAYLTSITGCSWSSESQNSRSVGGSVQLGEEIALIEGIAELRLGNGVYLSIEGPASLVIASPDSVVLQYGKITTHVPWTLSEFRVSAGSSQIAAADAEFGVSLTGSLVDVHVFSGEILVTDSSAVARETTKKLTQDFAAAANGQFLSSVAVAEGRALFLEAVQNGLLKIQRWGKADPSLFAVKLTMAGQLPVSSNYSDAVMASMPAGYWRFESKSNGTIENAVSDSIPLKIVGDLRLSGLSGNRYAEFRPGSDCYLSAEPLNAIARKDYSVEVWMKPSHVHCGTVLALCAVRPRDGVEMNTFMLELQSTQRHQVRGSFGLTHPNSVRYLHRDPPSRDWKKGTSCFSKDLYQVRRWQHVVATTQGETMSLYVNGVLEANATDTRMLAPRLRIVVGRQESMGRSYQFVGQLDELAIYPRTAEALSHYQTIDWKQAASPPAEGESPEPPQSLEHSS